MEDKEFAGYSSGIPSFQPKTVEGCQWNIPEKAYEGCRYLSHFLAALPSRWKMLVIHEGQEAQGKADCED